MHAKSFLRLAALALLLSTGALAQAPQSSVFEPSIGQEGKDVVWVPTSQALLEKMLDLARVTPAHVVMDLGSGDGRTVIEAARRGARAVGIEYDADMVELSKRNAEKAGLAGAAAACGAANDRAGAWAGRATGTATGERLVCTDTGTRGRGATTMRAHMPHMGCSPAVGSPSRERRRVRGPDCGGRKPQIDTLSLPSR